MVVDEEAGPRVDPLLAEAEVVVVDVDAPPADRADDVVVMRQIGPLEAAPALTPVDPHDLPLVLQLPDDPVDGGVGRAGQVFPDEAV